MTHGARPAGIPPAQQESAATGPEDTDPLCDLAAIAAELARRGMDGGRPIHLTYCLGFGDPETAAAAAVVAARDGWSTASYRWSMGDVVRLTRLGRADTRDLRADRDYLRRFAAARSGRWDAACLEVLAPDEYWVGVADRFIAKTVAAPAAVTRSVPRQRDRRAVATHRRSA
jgi:hypothetical protein